MKNTVEFVPGDIVWVPSAVPNRTKQLWPAKFLKQSNRCDICMVALYGSTPPQQSDEQFLVDTQSIIAFDQHEVDNPEPDLAFAYELALRDFKRKRAKMSEQAMLSNSTELCDFIENMLLAQLMEANSAIKENSVFDSQGQKLNAKDVPVQIKDLKLYFKRMIPQTISFILECRPPKQAHLKEFLQQVKNRIIKNILTNLSKNTIDFQN